MKKFFLGFISALTLLIFASGCDQQQQKKNKTSTEVAKAYIAGLKKIADSEYADHERIMTEMEEYTEGNATLKLRRLKKEISNRGFSGLSSYRTYFRAIANGNMSVTVDDPEHNNLHTAKIYCGKVFENDDEDVVVIIKLKRLDSNSKWYIYDTSL